MFASAAVQLQASMMIGCLRLSDVSFFAVLSTRVGRRRKFGEVSCAECTVQGNDFELIPMVETETRNFVEGYTLVVNFRRSVINADASSRNTLKMRNFCVFSEK